MINAVAYSLQSEIELTSEKFQRFLVIIPAASLQHLSKDITWTNAEILYKISVSPLIVHSILRKNFGSWTFRLLPVPGTGSLFQKWEEKSVRSQARRMTLAALAEEYQHNCSQVIQILEEFEEEDFERTLSTMRTDPLLSGQVKVEDLFHFVKVYFDHYRHLVDLNS